MVDAVTPPQPDEPTNAARRSQITARAAIKTHNWPEAVTARTEETLRWAQAGDRTRARRAADQTLTTLGKIVDRAERLSLASNAAIIFTEARLRSRAQTLQTEVEQERRADVIAGVPNASSALLTTLINIASHLIDNSEIDTALHVLTEAEQIAGTLNDPTRIGNVQINKAVALSSTGDLAGARHAYAQARQNFIAGAADPIDIGFALRGEAATLAQTGQTQAALTLFTEALKQFTSAAAHDEILRTTIGLIPVRAQLGEQIHPPELDYLERIATGLRPGERLQLLHNLGNVATQQNDLVRALRLHSEARDTYRHLRIPLEAARVDISLAVVLRALGELTTARTTLQNARQVLQPADRWLQVAQIDNNEALICEELAETTTDNLASAKLRWEASEHALASVAALDRYRHQAPSAADRTSLLTARYPGMFAVALRLCLAVSRVDEVAALIERARVQPVLPRHTTPNSGYLRPAPLAARRGAVAIGGDGRTTVLASLAERQLGTGAKWVGWWSSGTTRLRSTITTFSSRIDPEHTNLAAVAERVGSALAVVTDLDRAATNDEPAAQRLALWRAASGPLLSDPNLAERLAATLTPSALNFAWNDAAVQTLLEATGDAEFLWPVTQEVLGARLADELMTAADAGHRSRLVLSPPAELGRIPWAALPMHRPDGHGRATRLIDIADLVVGLPATLADRVPNRDGQGHGLVMICDPLGDLPMARQIHIPGATRLGHGHIAATRTNLLAALQTSPAVLVVAGHVSPGADTEPTTSAILLAGKQGRIDAFTVADLADASMPPTCVLLTCDGAGAATGTEWTGVATGLVWAGASVVVTTTWPVVDDPASVIADTTLLEHVTTQGPLDGLWAWQRLMLRRHEHDPHDPSAQPYRWAGTVAIGSRSRRARRDR